MLRSPPSLTAIALLTTVFASLLGCGSSSASTVGSDGGTSPGSDASSTADAGDASAWTGGACVGSPVTFELDTGASCTAGASCEDVAVLTIVAPDGASLATEPCYPSGHCSQPMHAPSSRSVTWDGTFYANCSDVASKSCAKSGHYTARFCTLADHGDGGATCEPASTPTCVDVPFDWPTAGPVKGSISL